MMDTDNDGQVVVIELETGTKVADEYYFTIRPTWDFWISMRLFITEGDADLYAKMNGRPSKADHTHKSNEKKTIQFDGKMDDEVHLVIDARAGTKFKLIGVYKQRIN